MVDLGCVLGFADIPHLVAQSAPPTPPPVVVPAPVVVGPVPERPPPMFEIVPLGGIQFLGSVGTPNGDLDVGFSSVWGISFQAHFPEFMPELSYTFQPTSMSLSRPFGSDQKVSDLTVHHVLATINREIPISRYVRPFVGFSIGLGIFVPDATNLHTETRFASALQAGSKFYFSERVGIEVMARFVSAFFSSGSTVFCGFGGCSYGLFGGGVSQLGFMIGPSVRF